MKLRYLAVLLSMCWAGRIEAQLNLLTLREAEYLIELVPDVVASQQRGECPVISPGYTEAVELEFWVRTTCGPGSGVLVNSYSVNRWTGAVETWGDNPQPVAGNQGSAAANQLVQQARKRVLSAGEAQCVALAAAKSLPGWSQGDAVVSVNPSSTPGTPPAEAEVREGVIHFDASRVSSSRPATSGRTLTVYLTETRVRDEETGADVTSAAVGDLSAKLLELRTPVWLSDEEAASVALSVPRVATSLREGCRLYFGGAFYSHEAVMGVSCKDGPIRTLTVLVNLETGAVADPDNRKSLDTAETQRVARELLLNARKRRAELQKAVQTICRPQ